MELFDVYEVSITLILDMFKVHFQRSLFIGKMINYKKLREQKAAEQQSKRKELFSTSNKKFFEEWQNVRQRDALKAQAMQVIVCIRISFNIGF